MAKAARKQTITLIAATPGAAAKSGEVAVIPGAEGVELQSVRSFFFGAKEIDFDKFLDQWRKVRDQVSTMITDVSGKSYGRMQLNEVEISIGVSGEGSIGIVTVKGEASVVLKFGKKT